MNALAERIEVPAALSEQIAPSTQLTPIQMAYQLMAQGHKLDEAKELIAFGKQLEADENEKAFNAAMTAAKAEIRPIVRRTKGHNGNYADLSTIADAIDPILSAHGLSYRHKVDQDAGGITVTCILAHDLGHKETTKITAAADTSGSKNSIQAIGSTQTYLMRYTLVAALGLSTAKDDDGQAAGSGSATVSEAQIAELRKLIEQTDTDIAKFCETFKIDALPNLPAAAFGAATKSMHIKLARKLSEAANA
jgi:hypothetical protein